MAMSSRSNTAETANEMRINFSDDELIQMTTSDLRLLLEQSLVTPEQHRQLRNRRRRLQNRKYARKCARKKQTEVEKLTMEVEEEVVEIRSLRSQLSRLCLATKQIREQIEHIGHFRQDCLRRDNSQLNLRPIRMFTSNGEPVGFAYIRPGARYSPSDDLDHSESYLSRSDHIRLSSNEKNGVHSPPSMPSQLASGPGLSSISDRNRFPWSSASHHLRQSLVRPVGGGLASRGHGIPEY